jgi:hypothetical protein
MQFFHYPVSLSLSSSLLLSLINPPFSPLPITPSPLPAVPVGAQVSDCRLSVSSLAISSVMNNHLFATSCLNKGNKQRLSLFLSLWSIETSKDVRAWWDSSTHWLSTQVIFTKLLRKDAFKILLTDKGLEEVSQAVEGQPQVLLQQAEHRRWWWQLTHCFPPVSHTLLTEAMANVALMRGEQRFWP